MRMRVKDCITLTERAAGLPKDSLYLPTRIQQISRPRQAAMLLARETGNSLSHIARVLSVDHTSVMYGIEAAKKRRNEVLEHMRAER